MSWNERLPNRKKFREWAIHWGLFFGFFLIPMLVCEWFYLNWLDAVQLHVVINNCQDWSAGLNPDLALDLPDCPAIADLTYEPSQGLVCTCPPKE